VVDDALVGADDGASVPLVEVQVGVGGRGNLGGEAEQKSSDHIWSVHDNRYHLKNTIRDLQKPRVSP
jgi:hypothetical protein